MPAFLKIIQYAAEQDVEEGGVCVCVCIPVAFWTLAYTPMATINKEKIWGERGICDIPAEIKEHNIRLKEDRNAPGEQSPPEFVAAWTGQIPVQFGL